MPASEFRPRRTYTPEQYAEHLARNRAWSAANRSRRAQLAAAWRQSNPAAARAQYVRSRCSHYNRAMTLLRAATHRAVRKRIEMSLTVDWVIERLDAGVCQATGLRFDLLPPEPGAFRNPFAPSIDRQDTSGPYSPSNCQLVCNIHNSSKGEWPPGAHRAYVEACARRYGLIP